MFEEYESISIKQFKGLFNRGTDDTVPQDHFTDCLNIVFPFGGADTRVGATKIFTLASIRRIVPYKRIGEATRFLILNGSGQLFDSTDLVTPILTIATMTDFAAVNFFNRIYISPHNGTKGLPNETVRVYDGTTLRVAAGVKPTGSLSVVNGAAGNIETGTHLFAVIFETASGYLTQPGPANFAILVADGTKKANFSGIPTGPSGTTKRKIIGTNAIQDYDSNQLGYEYFFIPNAVINNNVDTTLNDVNFYDAALVDSADDLFDQLETIPAGVILTSYRGRMIVGGFDADPSLIRVSKNNEPEAFDSVSSIITVDPTDSGGVTNAVEFRDILGIAKSTRSLMTSDNDDDPNTWEVLPWDKGVGTECHGINTILDAKGVNTDKFFLADRSGLLLFDGIFQRPELTFKIKDTWMRINKSAFNQVEVANDPVNQVVYVAVPLDGAATASHLFYGDYSEGLDFNNIKWTIWQFPWTPTTIVVDVENSVPVFKMGSIDGNIYKIDDTKLDDDTFAIDSYVQFPHSPQSNNGSIRQFIAFTARIKGVGDVQITAYGEDNVLVTNYNSFTLGVTPGKEFTRGLNFTNEKCSIKLRVNLFGEYFKLNSFILYHNFLWLTRPA